MPQRLSSLDASFLVVETPTAPMHVGWAAIFDPPKGRPRPSFEDLRDHIAARLHRAPRYRQRLASVPFGLHEPVWVDDGDFALAKHVLETSAERLADVVDLAMSAPLERSRPLWELWIAPRLSDGRIGIVGKVHHCMVDGLAAVELALLLLDAHSEPEPLPVRPWVPERPPSRAGLLAGAVTERMREPLELMRVPVSLLASSARRFGEIADDGRRAALAIGHALGPPAPPSTLNEPGSALRHLGMVSRSFADLQRIKTRHGTTVNDVVLAVCAGALRRYMQDRGDPPARLKAMVPVSVRPRADTDELGNQIVSVFIDLPCDLPDPVERLMAIHSVTSEQKRVGEPRGAQVVLNLVTCLPRAVQHSLSRLAAKSRVFNLVVSNVPGPPVQLYMAGCPLLEAYPMVPLPDNHALSIGVMTISGRACFGLFACRKSLPDVADLAGYVDAAVEELLRDPRDGAPDLSGSRRRHLQLATG
jgi:WS/DGAT/MGAT family acyltransferase